MNTYIALLRGINVGGHKKIKMADLRNLLENEGFKSVKTYIQSGNLVFLCDENNLKVIREKIEHLIEQAYGFNVPTHIISHEYLTSVIQHIPDEMGTSRDSKLLNFAFMYSEPITENLNTLLSYQYPNEEIVIANQVVYCYYGNGAAKAKFTGNFMENKLKVIMSSRNYNTVLKLIEMSKL